MANQRAIGVVATGELRTITTAAGQIVTSFDVTDVFKKSWDNVVFRVLGTLMSFEEAGGTDYAGFAEFVGLFVRRAGTLTLNSAIHNANDPALSLLWAVTAVSFAVSGSNVQMLITPRSGNIRHYGIIELKAYQYA